MPELKPCPSCGNPDVYEGAVYQSVKFIYCDKCGMKGPTGYSKECAEAWNALPRKEDAAAAIRLLKVQHEQGDWYLINHLLEMAAVKIEQGFNAATNNVEAR